MPIYEYRCQTCGEHFEKRQPASERGHGATCPAGHPGARRKLSAFATAGRGAGEARAAPVGSGAGCGPGCACAATAAH